MGEKKRRLAAGGAPSGAGDLSMQAVELLRSGRRDEALALTRRLIDSEVSHPEALHRLGFLLLQFGEPQRAIECIDRAVARSRDNPYLLNTRGIALRRLGRVSEAVESLQRAAEIAPGIAETWNNLGNACFEAGLFPQAFVAYRHALRIDPRDDRHWMGFGMSIGQFTIEGPFDEELRSQLAKALAHPKVAPGDVTRTARAALRSLPDFAALLERAVARGAGADIDEGLAEPAARAALADPLLLRLLDSGPLMDGDFELLMSAARRVALARACEPAGAAPFELDSQCAIACQCFLSEYAWAESLDEARCVEQLGGAIAATGSAADPWRVAVFAAYRPLTALPDAPALAEAAAGPVRDLYRQQVREPAEEERIRQEIQTVSGAATRVSDAVRAQYETNPYPRWSRCVFYDEPLAVTQAARLMFPHASFDPPKGGSTRILVAGCGTGLHPIVSSRRFANARILAIDLSLTSLAYAIRKTRELGIENVEYRQGDILTLPASLGRFDLIESVGVLHHIDEPIEAWRRLVTLLAPGGLMRIGLYSEAARRVLDRGKALAAALGAGSPEALRMLRAQIAADRHDPDFGTIRAMPDFYSLSGCRDLLAHVHEQQFTIPRLRAALEALDLEFLGFELSDRRVLREFHTRHPQQRIDDLTAWEAFEAVRPATFIGMYVFWVRRRSTGH